MPPVAGGIAAGAAVGPKLWNFFGKMAKERGERQTAAKIVQDLAEVRDFKAKETMLDEAERRSNINWLRQILTEQARHPGLLSEPQVESVSVAESGTESIWSGMPDMLVRVLAAVRMQRIADKS